MSLEITKEIPLEIAHVLFIDIVAYSKLSINEQHGAIDELTQVVRGSEQFQRAEATGQAVPGSQRPAGLVGLAARQYLDTLNKFAQRSSGLMNRALCFTGGSGRLQDTQT